MTPARIYSLLLPLIISITLPYQAKALQSDKPTAQVLTNAYQQLNQLHTESIFVLYQSDFQETAFINAPYQFAFDRENKQLYINRAGYFHLVCDGQTLFYKDEQIIDKHLQTPLPENLDYNWLIEQIPDLHAPFIPELILVLAPQPMIQFSDGLSNTSRLLKPRSNDPLRRPRHRLTASEGELTFSLTQSPLLVQEITFEMDRSLLTGSGLLDIRHQYKSNPISINQPIDTSLFQFDTQDSTACANFDELHAQPYAAMGAGFQPTLLGLELPDMELNQLNQDEPVKLRELEGEIQIFEFFATWTRSSPQDLTALYEFKTWANENNHDVHVYAVNVFDKSKELTEYMQQLDLDLPVLMDTAGQLTEQLRLPAIPRTIIVRNGKIIDVLGGNKPNLKETLQEKIPEWQTPPPGPSPQ